LDLQIALFLGQDGLVNGAIYALLALALVLVFSVTRVIFIPQGELVAFGALSLATLQRGEIPATYWLVVALSILTLGIELWRWRRDPQVELRLTLFWALVLPALTGLLMTLQPRFWPGSLALQSLTTVLLITPLGPLLYRLAYRPLADASILVLLIVSVAVHGILVGLGLWFFGAEGWRTPPFSDARFDWAGVTVSGQSIVVIGSVIGLVIAMFLFFERSILGKALRATAMNRVGARLMGIRTDLSGDLSFALAAMIGVISGLLIAPMTTVYYDTGFLIGLKGFVAAIVGGLASYPMALLGALIVGQLEAFSSFWASAFKEVFVFTLIVPVLLWRSLRSHMVEDEE
jgi:branched-chain amino acid transport system permease protein